MESEMSHEQLIRKVRELERSQLIAEIERLRAALEAIVAHQESLGGGLAVLSVSRRIAQKALTESPES